MLKVTLMKEMRIKVPKADKSLIEDPFIILGYGVNSYFDTMWSLGLMCMAITVFMIPVFYIYRANEVGQLDQSFINTFTLGNMGGATSICEVKRVGTQTMSLGCPAG